jgi:hypothetical protein
MAKERWKTIPALSTPSRGASGAISCVTSKFCVGAVGADVRIFNGHKWSAEVNLNAGTYIGITSISCATTTFCAAVTVGGEANTYNGHRWSPGVEIDSAAGTAAQSLGLIDVSCPNKNFCAALDQAGNVYMLKNGRWTTGSPVFYGQVMTSITCTSATFCMTISQVGFDYEYSGHSWTTGHVVEPDRLSFVSCASSTFCMGIGNGDVYTYSGGAWSKGRPFVGGPKLGVTSIDCPASGFCVVIAESVSYVGKTFVYVSGRWVTISGGGGSLSCTATGFCVLTADGYAAELS